MSFRYTSAQVSAPSTKPIVDTLGGSIWVAHRRVNANGGHTEISPIEPSATLPATATPQSYSDTEALQTDEFLVSDDSGVTWRIVPRTPGETGEQSIPAFDSGWATTSITDNQQSSLASIDFGEFSTGLNPETVFYFVNGGTPLNSLRFSFNDAVTGIPLAQFFGRIQVGIEGIFPQKGNNPDSSFDTNFVWADPGVSLNTIQALVPAQNFVKIRLTLINFPTGGFQTQNFAFVTQIQANSTKTVLPIPRDGWLSGSFLIDPSNGFDLPIVESDAAGEIKINPFLANTSLIIRSNYGVRTLTGEPTGSRRLYVLGNGTFETQDQADLLPTGALNIAEFTLNSSSPFITNLVYPWPIKPNSFVKLGDTSSIGRGLFAKLDSTGDVIIAESLGDEVGVSLMDSEPFVALSGLVWVVAGGTITRGEKLGPTTGGKATPNTSGRLVALEDGALDDLILAVFGA